MKIHRKIVCFAMLLMVEAVYPFTSPTRVIRNIINARISTTRPVAPTPMPVTWQQTIVKPDTVVLPSFSSTLLSSVRMDSIRFPALPSSRITGITPLPHDVEPVPYRLMRQGMEYFRDSLYDKAYQNFTLASIVHPDACAMRAYCLTNGLGTDRNDSLACSLTSYYAREDAAIYYHHFFSQEINDRFYATVLLMRMAESGDHTAAFLLDPYDELADSLSLLPSDRSAIALRAAEAGNEWAMYKLGRYALPDSVKAWEYWDAAAELGQPNALYEQWLRFGNTHNVHYRNYAVSCLNMAAIWGVEWAVKDMIVYCLQTEQNDEAFAWAQQGASLGYPDAYFYVGYCYQLGVGTEADKVLAKEWWTAYLQYLSASGMTHAEIRQWAKETECKPFLQLAKRLYR